ncbi:MAG: hypothetical protein ACYST6_05140 [Planctomycetota bacterium]
MKNQSVRPIRQGDRRQVACGGQARWVNPPPADKWRGGGENRGQTPAHRWPG